MARGSGVRDYSRSGRSDSMVATMGYHLGTGINRAHGVPIAGQALDRRPAVQQLQH